MSPDIRAEEAFASCPDGERAPRLEDSRYADLYIGRYASGHARGCPQAIPEVRAQVFPVACECGRWPK